jgi:hypothetical protein
MDPIEYRPELLPNRGEFTAWILTSLSGIAWIIMVSTPMQEYIGIPLLFFFFLISAFMISLGNWMDRNTRIKISDQNLFYQDGLRKIEFLWNEIQRVEVYPSKWGKKVRIFGNERRISFRTLGNIELKGEVKGKMGFTDGEKILNTILDKSNLVKFHKFSDGIDYYVRQ